MSEEETPNELIRQKQELEYLIGCNLYRLSILTDSLPNVVLKDEAIAKLKLPRNGIPEGNFSKVLDVIEELKCNLHLHQELTTDDKWMQRYTPNN